MNSVSSAKSFLWPILVASLIGLVDALYLTVKHYLQSSVFCSLLNGCDKVTGSSYATIIGIPVALMGMVYYFSLLLVTILILTRPNNKKFLKIIFAISSGGFLFSLWLVYLQIFVIKALCLYCLVSATVTTMIFTLSLIYLLKLKGRTINSNQIK